MQVKGKQFTFEECVCVGNSLKKENNCNTFVSFLMVCRFDTASKLTFPLIYIVFSLLDSTTEDVS